MRLAFLKLESGILDRHADSSASTLMLILATLGFLFATDSIPDRSAFSPHDWKEGQPRPTIILNLLCTSLADDDGGRKVPTTAREYNEGVEWMNRVYAPAGILFRTKGVNVKNTRLNSLQSTDEVERVGTGEASRRLREDNGVSDSALVALYRWGSKGRPNGQGLGGYPFHEVLLSARSSTNAGPSMLAHEIGHALGLGHTFSEPRSADDALAYLAAHSSNPKCFDGDGLDDTAPDPGVPFNVVDGVAKDLPTSEYRLGGVLMTLPKGNLMSYIGQEWLSPKQMQIARWHALSIIRKNEAQPGDFMAESLRGMVRGDVNWQIQDMAPYGATKWSTGKTLFAKTQPGERAVFTLKVEKGHAYRLAMFSTQAPDYADIDVAVDGTPMLTGWPLYAPLVMPSGRIPISDRYVAKSNKVEINFSANKENWIPGRNAVNIDSFYVTEIN